MGEMSLEVMMPLYKKYPALEPKELKKTISRNDEG